MPVTNKNHFIAILSILWVTYSSASLAQYEGDDPRKSPELTICSQNLENFGSYEDVKTRSGDISLEVYNQKIAALVLRFVVAQCDLVAVQELLGKTEIQAQAALNSLAQALTKEASRPFEARVSSIGDGAIRNGFIISKDRAEVVNLISYSRIELPRLLETEKTKVFERAPLEIQLQVKGKDDTESKIVTLIDFHLKSRSGAAEDPTGLQFETVRMQMAESLRRLVDLRHSDAFTDPAKILVLLGDRNTDFQMAAARILEGSLALMDFKSDGPCRLSKRGLPICKTEQRRPQKLFSPLLLDPETKGVAGSFYYKEEASWIDDILVPQVALKYVLVSPYDEGNYDSGTVSKPKLASDHSLVFCKTQLVDC